MPDEFQCLVKAILDDDRPRTKELLKQNAALATAGATKARYESGIAHWIYAGDSALHVAAAGYRVEIANYCWSRGRTAAQHTIIGTASRSTMLRMVTLRATPGTPGGKWR